MIPIARTTVSLANYAFDLCESMEGGGYVSGSTFHLNFKVKARREFSEYASTVRKTD